MFYNVKVALTSIFNINLKILNYSEIEQGSSIELSDGLLYPLNVIPEGKSKMLFEDYLRGLK